MILTSPPTPNFQPTWTPDQPAAPTTASVLAGIGAAIAFQVVAATVAIGSMVVVLAAAFANFGSYGAEQESTWWVIFAVPLAIAAVVAYVMSGFAAAKIMRTGLGWLTLLIAPGAMLALTVIV